LREEYGFTGKEADVEVGLTYFGKRFLVPSLGRWLNPDPLALHAAGQADLNLYAYVSGRVFTSTDLWGLDDKKTPAPMPTASPMQPPPPSAPKADMPSGGVMPEVTVVGHAPGASGPAPAAHTGVPASASTGHNSTPILGSLFPGTFGATGLRSPATGLDGLVGSSPHLQGLQMQTQGVGSEMRQAGGAATLTTGAAVVGGVDAAAGATYLGVGMSLAAPTIVGGVNAASTAANWRIALYTPAIVKFGSCAMDAASAPGAPSAPGPAADGLVVNGRNYINSARVVERAAAEPGPFHNFPGSFDRSILEQGTQQLTVGFFRKPSPGLISSGVQYSLSGAVNGQAGTFEIGTRLSQSGSTEVIMHRFFRPER
jgi:RHS repeat-associated protein